ncbi:MAG: DUF429 domain-containing protein [Candidatus Sedimenticola sp. (ex Thyasira tokunagai)]
MKLAGVDLAWLCNKNPTAIAIGDLAAGVLTVSSVEVSVLPVEQIRDKLLSVAGLAGIAVDASLIIPNQMGQRGCEKEISKHYGAKGASCHASNLTLYPEPASVEMSLMFADHGFGHLGKSKWQLECYPHPAIIEIFALSYRLAYKKGRVADKKAGQKQLASLIKSLSNSPILPLHIDTDICKCFEESYLDSLCGKALKSNEDALDAVVCLYIAGLYAIDAPGRVFGNVDDGYIWVPQGSALPN